LSREMRDTLTAIILDESVPEDVRHLAEHTHGKVWRNRHNEKYRQKILDEAVLESAASDFPFNRSFTKDVHLGGKVINVDFSTELFAGTNFNCHQPNFNYKSLATVQATASLFGYSKQAFMALAAYGRDNGAAVVDAMQVSVWGDLIYNKPFTQVDCNTHTYPIAHTAPGFNVQYTIWVSVIPVVFSASTALNLDLSWDWSICDSQLSTLIQVLPVGTLSVAGGTVVDLLTLRAGVELSGSFNLQLVPEAYIHGTQCEVGFQVDEINAPMAVMFDSFYQWQQCKFLFFDCHWGTHNEHAIWQWSEPQKDIVLLKQTWKIAP